ncbi:LysE/ArgO family amino acid transporter [Staphylococcus aureus]|uniref:LysE/ArgO family amino acid transporter n=1 Tax=Staphylococcus aureus TaxID=1280 RepID=UPI001291E9E2|nr:LysE/ArgO family amino acid transporter [Staphylococcus aureus]MBX4349775.1 LysE/ArgO family amino acid transporter [Staphylococcus aureus]MBX4358172.1 LysE/ArgO family amino acid transporter [Staphylococcus aureus]MBX4367830.1 LysE/ArgO family amino acid transporter [Staphylococcus aureus]MBX4394094.1 LysE/ArgO family amino acid transporter [Staphylococcus aureus]MBX4398233.1 LysE/ArgO family amino acid transporter [Staphylococcus aureus]
MVTAIIHGFILAIGLILPLGAQNVFIFNQGANQPKYRYVLPAIITAGLSDSLLIIAVVGVSIIIMSLPVLQAIIYIVGLIFLMYMAWTIWHDKPSTDGEAQIISPMKQVSFALSVSLLNPHAILDTIGVIGSSAALYSGSNKIAFTIACISVSWLWFFLLAILGKMVGSIDKTGKLLTIINKISSIIIIIVALMILQKLIQLLF